MVKVLVRSCIGMIREAIDPAHWPAVTKIAKIEEREAQRVKLDLARREGLLVGISAGAAVKVALDQARALGKGKTVVTILPDTGERYFSSDEYFSK